MARNASIFPSMKTSMGCSEKVQSDVPRGIESDQAGHNTQQHLIPIERTHVATLQIRDLVDVLVADHLEAPATQAGQQRDRCAGVHRTRRRWVQNLAQNQPRRARAWWEQWRAGKPRTGALPSALTVPDIGKALGAQQPLHRLRRNTGDRILLEANLWRFPAGAPTASDPPPALEPGKTKPA